MPSGQSPVQHSSFAFPILWFLQPEIHQLKTTLSFKCPPYSCFFLLWKWLFKKTTFNHLTFLPQELFFNRVANQKNIPPSFSYLQRSWFLSGFSLKTLELEAICASTNSGYHFQQRVSTDSSRIIYYLYTLEPKFMNDSHDQEMWGPGKSLPFGLSKIFLVLALRAPYPRKPLSAGQTVTIGHLSLERYLRVQAPWGQSSPLRSILDNTS